MTDDGEAAPSVIEQGSPTAWQCRRLIEAWVAFDPDQLDVALRAADHNLPAVLQYMAVVAGGTINAVALALRRPYEEQLEEIFLKLAAQGTDNEMAQLARTVVTAWTDPEPDFANSLNASGAWFGVDTDELLMHLLGLTMIVAEQLTKALGQPLTYALDGFWGALGTAATSDG